MSTFSRLPALALSLALGAFVTSTVHAEPYIDYRWPVGVGTKPVYIHSNMPELCDNAVLYSVDTWNQAGARFAFTWPSNPITAYRNNEQGITQDLAQITIEDGAMPSTDPYAPAATAWGIDANGYLRDADIFVNRQFLFYAGGTTPAFYCAVDRTSVPPAGSNQYDYRTVILHELGHTLHFQDDEEMPSCVMYAYINIREVRRSLCSAEYLEFRGTYGVR